ncbi:alpha-galactosidase [Paenibacillus sp. S150]|uniref:alpha-galactosidase n=1 Tax=Paenibacillus sp. S150 TaxID=2749826 RepID=UPI002815E784|nr:alpha-galactosidase [Paenibacillus sp. S150]
MGIHYWEQENIFELRTERSSYVFGVNEQGILQHLYWGEPVEARECAPLLAIRTHSSFDNDLNSDQAEYGGRGGGNYAEPCLHVHFSDGVRDLKLRYAGCELVSENRISIRLSDDHYPLRVELGYTAIPEVDLIERDVRIFNGGDTPVRVIQAMAASWTLPPLRDYRLTHVTGRWAGEYQLRSQPLSEGRRVLESRRGFTGPHSNPWFAVDNGRADEETGKVWFGALAWSGNWKITAEKSNFGRLHVLGGINDFDGAFELGPGAVYSSPVFTGGYVSGGFGAMSRNLHLYQSRYILPGGRVRKVLYNSWEATGFAVNVQEQKKLARQAARLGVERFVVDDGWFGARNSDMAGLGDWTVNPEKFPLGLQELIDEVKGFGMDFGLWVEPESVNPDSDLYRQHPDWVYQFPNREGTLLRNQLMLNLGHPEVKAFVLEFMTELLDSYDISFIKWDMNRTVTEPGAFPLAEHAGDSVWIRHVEHLYEIWAELRQRFPQVEFETCAGGGARIDLGMLRYADQAWISDNTDALDRLLIQEGFCYAYSPSVMMCWVTESPHGMNGRSLPLAFRFHSAMMGGLGIGADIGKWSDAELSEAARFVAQYKKIRHVIAEGSLYRLASVREGGLAAGQYVSPDRQETVVFAFRQAQHFGYSEQRITLRGLDPDAVYSMEAAEGLTQTLWHGSTLMNLGLPLSLSGDYASRMIHLQRQPAR